MIKYLLVVVVLVILFTTRENEKLKEVNEKYKKLREHLKEAKNEKFEMLTRHIPITGKLWMSQTVGTNRVLEELRGTQRHLRQPGRLRAGYGEDRILWSTRPGPLK